MLTNFCRNVLYVKDIHSNIIEEAFFVLKNNDVKNIKMCNEIAMSEIDSIIDTFLMTFNKEKEDKNKMAKAKNELKKVKIITSLCISAFVISCIIMSLIGTGVIKWVNEKNIFYSYYKMPVHIIM